MRLLVDNHARVAARCQQAYSVAATAGDRLCQAVRHSSGSDMSLAFVNPEQAALGFTTSTFSFNLPAPRGATAEVLDGLAQRFVDLLCVHPHFKPCVSFGQDNGLVYATVPATSTQGAIEAKDKAKQAVGGVQLVRLSFPPTSTWKPCAASYQTAVPRCISEGMRRHSPPGGYCTLTLTKSSLSNFCSQAS